MGLVLGSPILSLWSKGSICASLRGNTAFTNRWELVTASSVRTSYGQFISMTQHFLVVPIETVTKKSVSYVRANMQGLEGIKNSPHCWNAAVSLQLWCLRIMKKRKVKISERFLRTRFHWCLLSVSTPKLIITLAVHNFNFGAIYFASLRDLVSMISFDFAVLEKRNSEVSLFNYCHLDVFVFWDEWLLFQVVNFLPGLVKYHATSSLSELYPESPNAGLNLCWGNGQILFSQLTARVLCRPINLLPAVLATALSWKLPDCQRWSGQFVAFVTFSLTFVWEKIPLFNISLMNKNWKIWKRCAAVGFGLLINIT